MSQLTGTVRDSFIVTVVEDVLKDSPILSIVVPVYNEEQSVIALHESVRNACKALGKFYELIFVDDGSQDGTFDLLENIHKQDPSLKVVRFRKNYGQTAAMAAGFQYAQGEIIVSMDGDLQNDPADIPRLLSKLEEGYDVVCGWRKSRQDKFFSRRLPSVVANWIIGRVTGVRIHDNGCSLKAYRASVIKSVALYGEMHRFIPAMSTLTGARIVELEVQHHARQFGKSKYGIGRVWRVAVDIITIKMITSFATRPAVGFSLPSIPLMSIGLSLFVISLGFLSAASFQEWIVMSTIAFLACFLGVHLLGVGVVGELCMKTGDFRPHKVMLPTITKL